MNVEVTSFRTSRSECNSEAPASSLTLIEVL